MAPQYNPVAHLDAREKPEIAPSSTRCLEVPEAALLLEIAWTWLQTLDRSAPGWTAAPRMVEKELGHRSRDMLEEVYGRLGDVRHRSEVVEYRVEQHFDWDGRAWVPKQSAPKTRTISAVA